MKAHAIPALEELRPPDGFAGHLAAEYLFDYARRAYALLADRSLAEVNAAVDGLTWMFEHNGPEVEEAICELAEAPDAPMRYSIPHMLRVYMTLFDIANQPDFPNARWSEYFGALALNIYVRFMHPLLEEYDDRAGTGAEIHRERFNNARSQLLDVAEALAIGETLQYSDKLLTQAANAAKEKISLRARRAAKAKNKPTNDLLRELVEFYRGGTFSTMTEAVGQFLETVDPERLRHLAPTNHMRLLREGLSNVLKGKRPL